MERAVALLLNYYKMCKKHLHLPYKALDVEVINVRTKKRRVIDFNNEEKVLYNIELKDFQLLPVISSSYEQNSEQTYD